MEDKILVTTKPIKNRIFIIRDKQVMIDKDLAELYGVEVRVLNEAVKRNKERFPEDFMFQINKEEFASLRSHFVTLKGGRGKHRKYLPYAFTEQGVSMLASVLKSKQAVDISIQIIRASLKDLGKKWFAFTKMKLEIKDILNKLEES